MFLSHFEITDITVNVADIRDVYCLAAAQPRARCPSGKPAALSVILM